MCEHTFCHEFHNQIKYNAKVGWCAAASATAAAPLPYPLPWPVPIGMSNGSRVSSPGVVLWLHLELCDLLDASRDWTVNGALHLKQNSQMDI